jgi:hypothetical protein
MGLKTLNTALFIGALSWLALPSAASAQFRFFRSNDNCNQCQPAYGQPVYPGQPAMPSQVIPGQPSAIPAPKDVDIKDKKDADKKGEQLPQPDQAQQQQQDFSPDIASAMGPVGGGESMGVPMAGRGDFANRFNLFDNMAAIPQNRIWFGYQILDGFNTGAQASGPSSPDYNSFYTPRRQENLYRVGFEYMLNPNLSFVAQTQYIDAAGITEQNDCWSNPQFAIKYVLARSCDCVMSAFLGVQPADGNDNHEIKDIHTRVYPGLLFYRSYGPRTFVQGGTQFGISTNDSANTWDFAVSVGYWLYKDCSHFANYGCNGCRGCGGCYGGGCGGSCIVGIIPQIELFGKEVINNADNIPYADVDHTTSFHEPEHTYDVTFSVRVLMRQGLGLAVGASLPLTGGNVRDAEFLSSINYSF